MGMGGVKRRGNIWWIRYSRNGKRYEESSHSAQRQVANDLLKLRQGDIARGVPVTPKIGRFTFHDAVADLFNDYTANARRSARKAQGKVNNHLVPYFSGRRMAEISTADIRAYIAHRQTGGVVNQGGERVGDVSNGEINRELSLLGRMFTLAVQAGKLLNGRTSRS